MEYKNALWLLVTVILFFTVISVEITISISSQTSFNNTIDIISNSIQPTLIEYDGKIVDGYVVRDIANRFPDNISITTKPDLNKRYTIKIIGERGAQQIKVEEVSTGA